MSNIIVAIHSARPVSEEKAVVPVREIQVFPPGDNRAAVVEIGAKPGSPEGLFFPAGAAASAKEVYSAPRPVENLAELAPLHLPPPVPAPQYAPGAAYPEYHYRQAREAYETATRLDRRPQKLLSISI